MTKASERVVKAPYDGQEVIDNVGRVIKLRKPSLLDTYDLMKALGDDSKNTACLGMAYNVLYVGMIDGQLMTCPKTYSEFRMMLQRLDDHGLAAVNEGLAKYELAKTEQEANESAKK
jgi:hypothetical protein